MKVKISTKDIELAECAKINFELSAAVNRAKDFLAKKKKQNAST